MLVTVNRFGIQETVEVPDDRIYEFEQGLGAFEQHHHYALIPEPDSPIEWLQSLHDPAVGFALLDPFLFYPGYAFELPDCDAVALRLQRPEDAQVRCVLTVREAAEETTANLLAPIVLNVGAGLGRQVVLTESDLPLRYPVFESLRLAAGT